MLNTQITSLGDTPIMLPIHFNKRITKENVPSSFNCVYARYAMALMDAYIESVASGLPDKRLWKLITDNRANIISGKDKSIFNRYILKYKLTFLSESLFNIIIRKASK